MPKPNALKLSARFVAVLYAATNGRSGQFRRIDDCAAHAGITRAADVKRAVATAEAAGLLVVHVSEPLVMLTTKGCEAAQPGRGSEMTKRVLLVVGFLLAIGMAATLIAGPAKSQTLGGGPIEGATGCSGPASAR